MTLLHHNYHVMIEATKAFFKNPPVIIHNWLSFSTLLLRHLVKTTNSQTLSSPFELYYYHHNSFFLLFSQFCNFFTRIIMTKKKTIFIYILDLYMPMLTTIMIIITITLVVGLVVIMMIRYHWFLLFLAQPEGV